MVSVNEIYMQNADQPTLGTPGLFNCFMPMINQVR